MPWYVFALLDAVPAGRPRSGLTGPLSVRRVGRTFAVVERRADVPPPAFGTLRRHQRVVAQLADAVPAILPVRFGTLIGADELDAALSEHAREIRDALDSVRERVQFTWRRAGAVRRRGAAPPGPHRPIAPSGAEYLRRAAREAKPSPPAAWRQLRATLAPLVAAERYQPHTPTTPESLYHLVPRDRALAYATMAAGLRDADASLTMTGPWPPFAFAPEVL